MPLDSVYCYDNPQLCDISPLKGMRLRKIECYRTQIVDLTPLKGMPLIHVCCDFVPERDTKILRSINTLEKINNLPTKEFWKRVEAGEVPQAK